MRIKITATLIYFYKKVCMKINPIHNLSKKCFFVLKMLYFDRIDVSEGFDANEIRELKECNICHYWYF